MVYFCATKRGNSWFVIDCLYEMGLEVSDLNIVLFVESQ